MDPEVAAARRQARNRRAACLSIVVLAVLLRLAFFAAVEPWRWNPTDGNVSIIVGDSLGYHRFAQSAAEGGLKGLIEDRDPVTALGVPAYPLYVALFYHVAGTKPWLVMLSQVFVDVLTLAAICALAYRVSRSASASLLAAFLYAINQSAIFQSMQIRPECLLNLVLTSALLAYVKALDGRKAAYFAASGLLFGLAALVKPIILYLPPFLLVALAFDGGFVGQAGRKKVMCAAALVLSFSLVIAPWQLRNLSVFGHYSLTDAQGLTVYLFEAALLKADIEGGDWTAISQEWETGLKSVDNPFQASMIAEERGEGYILQHPLRYAYLHFRGIFDLFTQASYHCSMSTFGIGDDAPGAGRILSTLCQLRPLKVIVENIFALLGLLAMYAARESRRYATLFLLVLAYLANIVGILGSAAVPYNARYFVPMIPVMSVLAAYGMARIAGYAKKACGKAQEASKGSAS